MYATILGCRLHKLEISTCLRLKIVKLQYCVEVFLVFNIPFLFFINFKLFFVNKVIQIWLT